ncbi:hypothetical protein FA13DRAFT_1714970 [Coprinellus micaceus]|uniref:Uncharacterized protein n=1 Tax=Coprinellus micaceus TaxID=71717 RepID=A0A4Y7SQA7_COPMI|nr:hypothetical protein FA13DRAFT_1714970 [Coprinellus micaceus]
MARSDVDMAVLAIIASLGSDQAHVREMTIGSLKQIALQVASSEGCLSLSMTSIEAGLLHLEVNGLVEIDYNNNEDLSLVNLGSEWIELWGTPNTDLVAIQQQVARAVQYQKHPSKTPKFPRRRSTDSITGKRGRYILSGSTSTAYRSDTTDEGIGEVEPRAHSLSELPETQAELRKEYIRTVEEEIELLRQQYEIAQSHGRYGEISECQRKEYGALQNRTSELSAKARALDGWWKALDTVLDSISNDLTPQRLWQARRV